MPRLALALLLTALLAPVAIAQTDGFLITNAAGDTLFYAAPDGTVLYGPEDARVVVTAGGEGLTSTVTRTAGNPSAGIFAIDNVASTSVALLGSTNGTGVATSGWAFSEGIAGGFYNYSGSNSKPAIESFTLGTGPVLALQQRSGDPLAPIVSFQTANGFEPAVQQALIRGDGKYFGQGAGFDLPTGYVTVGTDYGHGIDVEIDQTTEYQTAGLFRNTAPSSIAPTVQIEHASDGNGLFSLHRGSGNAVVGRSEGTGSGVEGVSTGTGSGGFFLADSPTNENAAVVSRTVGLGSAAAFFVENTASTNAAVFSQTVGTGAAVFGNHEGPSGEAGHFAIRDAGNESPAVLAYTAGAGSAGYFEIGDAGNANTALGVRTYGAGAAVVGHSDLSSGGKFFSDAGTEPALDGVTYGAGAAFRAVQNSGGLGGTVAEFVTADDWSNYEVVMRVATDGNVYADGAFHGGGADFAERFEVIGGPAAYEVGDVLAISTQQDRHLERAAEPYSTRILGVYATRPGVLLGDPSIAPGETVPVGVVGVVPTKVTGEGGPIRRGDLLVTSSTAGHAMRGEPGRMGVGMVIGKALQDFDGARGVIEVMVNVQ